MKKLAALLAGAILMMASTAGATSFTSTTNLDRSLSGTGTTTWTQAMPADFEIPYDTVTSAILKIYSNYVDGSNDRVYVESTYMGTLTNNESWDWLGLTTEVTNLNVASAITSPWVTGSPLHISLNYDETGWFNSLCLDKSVLCLEYNNGAAPVPEPGTVMLLGIGMFGVAVFGKRRMNKA